MAKIFQTQDLLRNVDVCEEPVALGNATRGLLLCIHRGARGSSGGSFQSGRNESDASVSEGLIRRERSKQDKNKALFQCFSKSFCLFSLRLASQDPRIAQLEESSRGLCSSPKQGHPWGQTELLMDLSTWDLKNIHNIPGQA